MDLKKLDKTIKELDKSSRQLKDFSVIFAELSDLHSSVSKNNDFFTETLEILANIKFSLVKDLKIFKQTSKNINSSLETGLEGMSGSIDSELKHFKTKINDLDSSIVTRLDRHKSDIKVDIRNEGTQIQRGFENSLNSNFNNLESKINDKFRDFETKIKSNKTLIIISLISGLINIGLIAYLIIK